MFTHRLGKMYIFCKCVYVSVYLSISWSREPISLYLPSVKNFSATYGTWDWHLWYIRNPFHFALYKTSRWDLLFQINMPIIKLPFQFVHQLRHLSLSLRLFSRWDPCPSWETNFPKLTVQLSARRHRQLQEVILSLKCREHLSISQMHSIMYMT